MKPSVTMSTKIRVVTAQNMNVCCGLAGPNSPMLNDPCQTTSTTDKARTKKPKPSSSRFFICGDIYSIIRGSGAVGPLPVLARQIDEHGVRVLPQAIVRPCNDEH